MIRALFLHLAIAGMLAAIVSCKPSSTGSSSKASPLRVGMELTYPPFEMQNEKGQPDGVSVKLAEALADHLNRPLRIVPMEYSGLIPALKTRHIDVIISSMTASEERRQSIDFSSPYAHTGLAMLVAKDSPIQSVDDLKNKKLTVAVKSATTGELWTSKNLPESPRSAFIDEAACVMEVIQGRAAAFIYDQLSILRYHRKNPNTTRALLQPITEESWAVGVAKDNPEMLRQTNEFLEKFRSEGGFERLAKQYLAEDKKDMEASGVTFILR